jgi:hypothetical protein
MRNIEQSSRSKFNPVALGLAIGCIGLAATVRATDETNAAPPGPEVTGRHANQNFWNRFGAAETEALSTAAYTPPPPVPAGSNAPPQANRRGHPTPFDAPPFPDGEWQLGGTPAIGDQNQTPDFPLMQAIYDGPHGQAWRDSRIKFYGWEDFSGNLSTSHNTAGPGVYTGSYANGASMLTGNGANFPLAYDQRPNRLEQNQFVLYAERTPDEFQTNHVDWGFRMSWVYGLDYRYMISRGWDSDQLVKRDNFYGMDTPMMYLN